METQIESKMNLEKSFNHADVFTVSGTRTAVVQATGDYITIDEFKNVFNYIGKLVMDKQIDKLVFDKRKLNVFHQPSMEWYFVEWKEEMFNLGLKKHRKILPNDSVFRQSVKIGRENIDKTYPNGKFHEMDIQYFEDLDEAINN